MEYWMISTGESGEEGINGGLAQRTENNNGTTNTIGVDSVDEALKAVEAHGGKVTMGKGAIPGVGWLAYFQDPEGNSFGLMQSDPTAA
jgi:predicted enzyme related to lactoylglutathione lyase